MRVISTLSFKFRADGYQKSFSLILVLVISLTLFTAKVVSSDTLSMAVIDAKNGQELFSQNDEIRRQPASLTKMMTLYLTFYSIEVLGQISLDQRVKISKKASKEPPSRLGLEAGKTETIRNLIRSAALRSANDSATVLAEVISGTERKFAEYMTLSAKIMGMENTQFKNAHGLTEQGHYSTASDMAILARRLMMDFPEYYHLFGKMFTTVNGNRIKNTNWKFLKTYRGADGIKTGYTQAAGFNLAASAQRSSGRVIGVILGASGSGERTKRMTEMLDMGFSNIQNFPNEIPLSAINLRNLSGKNAAIVSQINRFPPPRTKNTILQRKFDTIEIRNFTEVARPKIFQRPNSLYLDSTVLSKIENSSQLLSDEKDHLIHVGFYYTISNAERDITKVILSSIDTLADSKASIVDVIRENVKGYSIEFEELTAAQAMKACARIRINSIDCVISLR